MEETQQVEGLPEGVEFGVAPDGGRAWNELWKWLLAPPEQDDAEEKEAA